MILDTAHQGKKFIVAASGAIALVPRDVDTHHAREGLYGLDKTHVVKLHEETDRGAVRATAEAMIKTFIWTDRERRCLFVVERAAGFELAACFFELDASPEDLDDVRSRDQVVNKILGNHLTSIVVSARCASASLVAP